MSNEEKALTNDVRVGLYFLLLVLSPPQVLKWEIHIRHVIPINHNVSINGGACVTSRSMYCPYLKFCFFMPQDEEFHS